MNEDELMQAVHEYADKRYDGEGNESRAARSKLLEAIEAYAHRKAFNATHPSYQLLLAKADVCNAFLSESESWDVVDAAVEALRELLATTQRLAQPRRATAESLTVAAARIAELEGENERIKQTIAYGAALQLGREHVDLQADLHNARTLLSARENTVRELEAENAELRERQEQLDDLVKTCEVFDEYDGDAIPTRAEVWAIAEAWSALALAEFNRSQSTL